jgi:adenylate cyclase
LAAARILVVDDKEPNVILLERILRGAGYLAVSSTRDPTTVCALHVANRYDLILLDLMMPVMDGFAVLEVLQGTEPDGYAPVIVITAQPNHKLRALRAGAKDFISKPFDAAEVLTRVRNMLEVRLLHGELRRKNAELHALVDQVVSERKRAERVALHADADSIALRLPPHGKVTAEGVPEGTVLVADVVGFAELSPARSAAELRVLVDELFLRFDALVFSAGLRKVKTKGNSYMAAAGLASDLAGHAARAVQLALAMGDAVAHNNERTGAALQLRVGLASGPLVATVVGKHRFLYDVWGDTATTAAYMESHGLAGQIQLSDATRLLLGDAYEYLERPGMDVAGEGTTKAWFLGVCA